MRKLLLTLALATTAHAAVLQRAPVQLICHRTANRDLPENTLASLAYAARMGCNVVELDIRTTQDGTLVLNHDGYLERLTEGMGDIETTDLAELDLLDFGAWMSPRFANTRIARFDDALRLARSLGISLHLDIKTPNQGARIFAALQREGMVEHILYGSEDGSSKELADLMPPGLQPSIAWFGPDVTREQIAAAHAAGKFTVANFSANTHEMDLPAMRAAVAAGIDALNTDYPRLAADAAGRPVEARLQQLATSALAGDLNSIRELSHYTDFPLTPLFTQLLNNTNPKIAHAAALALIIHSPTINWKTSPLEINWKTGSLENWPTENTTRLSARSTTNWKTGSLEAWPAESTTRLSARSTTQTLLTALTSPNLSTRTAAVWALGTLHAPAIPALLPLLQHSDPTELKETLLALSRMPGDLPAKALLPFLENNTPTVRAAAALALATHAHEAAAKAIPALLLHDEQRSAADYATYLAHGKHKLTQAEIDPIVEQYREHMKLIHALELLPPNVARPLLTTEAFRVAEDSSHVTSVLAGYGLWDLIAADPASAIPALSSPTAEVADRAEWMLTKADASILPTIRAAIATSTPQSRPRLFHILAWHGDTEALPLLHQLLTTNPNDPELLWSIQKIQSLQFTP